MARLIIINILLILIYKYVHTEFKCPEHIEDEFLPDPDDCRIFYRCFSGQQVIFSCGPGTAFDPINKSCDWPNRVECKTNIARDTSLHTVNYNIRPYKYPVSNDNYQSARDNSEIYLRFDKQNKNLSGNNGRNSNENYNNRPSFVRDNDHYSRSYNYNRPTENQEGYSEQPYNTWNQKNTHQRKPKIRNKEYQSIDQSRQTLKQEIPNMESRGKTENDYKSLESQKPNLDKSSLEKTSKQSKEKIWSGYENYKSNETFRNQEHKWPELKKQDKSLPNIENNAHGKSKVNIIEDKNLEQKVYQWSNPKVSKQSNRNENLPQKWNPYQDYQTNHEIILPNQTSFIDQGKDALDLQWSETKDPNESDSFRPTMNPWDKRILNERIPKFPNEWRNNRNSIESLNKPISSEGQSINAQQHVDQKYKNLQIHKDSYHPEASSFSLYQRPQQPKNRWLYPEKKETDQSGPFYFDSNENKEFKSQPKYRNDYNVKLPEYMFSQSKYQPTRNPLYDRKSKATPFDSSDYFLTQKSEKVEDSSKSDNFWPLKPREKWLHELSKEYGAKKSNETPNTKQLIFDISKDPSKSNRVYAQNQNEDFENTKIQPKRFHDQNTHKTYRINDEHNSSNKYEDPNVSNYWWRNRVIKREYSDLNNFSNQFHYTYKDPKIDRNQLYPPYEVNLKMDKIHNTNSKIFNKEKHSFNPSDLMEYINLESFHETNEIISKLTEKDPYAVPDLMSNIKCSELNLENCECEQLSWLKFPKILLNSTIHETITTFFKKEERMKSCFQRCEDIGCVAFSLNKLSRICHLYKGPVHVQEVITNSEFETVIKEPTTTIFGNQWLLVNNSIPIGKPLLILEANNKLECVKLCVETSDCKVSAFILKECLLYDAINGEKLALQANSTTIQHRSIHEKDNKWRFKYFERKRLNGTIPMYTFAIRDEQECLDDCLSKSECLFVSIESMVEIYRPGFKECHIYNSLSTYNEDKNFKSYLLQIPRNSHYFLEMPNIRFYGTALIERKTSSLEKCLEIAKYTVNSIKVTYHDNKCSIYSDSANIRYEKNKSINSFVITIPSQDEYIPFKRITGLTLNSTYNNNNNYEYINDLSVSLCLSKCLKTLNCVGVSAKYHGNSLFCLYLAEDDINSPQFIFSHYSELFIKTSSKSDSHCSSRSQTRSSNENLNEFEQYFAEVNKKLSHPKNYDEENYIMPHDHNFHGMRDLDKVNYGSKRNKRSTYALTIEGAKLYKILTQDYNIEPFIARNEAGSHINNLMQGWLSKPLPTQDYYLLNQFIFTIENRLAQKKDELLESMINSAIRARRERGLLKKCKQLNRYGIREGFCRENEICSSNPSIAYSEEENDCINARINSTCPVNCRFGYLPSASQVKCESLEGHEAVWNTKNVECKPDITMCSQLPWIVVKIDNAFKKNRTNYIIKYGEKSPIFSLYYHSFLNSFDNSVKLSQLLTLPCPQIRSNQVSYLHYKKNPYVPGFLASPNSFKFSQKAHDSTHYFFNTAPQDPYSKKLWKILQSKIDDYLKIYPGFVVSGVCSKKLKDERNISSFLEVPACFWKIVCIKINGEVSAAAFFHENTLVYSKEEKRDRLEQVLSYTNQDFISGLIEDKDYISIWKEAIEKYEPDLDDRHFVRQCANEQRIKPEHLKYWNQILSHEENDWNDEIEDDSLSMESSLSSVSISPSFKLILSACDKKLVGYIGLGSKMPKVNSLTHLILLSSVQILSNGRLTLNKHHTSKIYNKIYQLKSLKKDNPQLKILFGLGGWNNSQYFSNISRDSKLQKNFITNILGLLDYWDFDGIDIIWQYPVVGGNSEFGSPDDRLNLVKLLHSLRISLLSHSQRRSREPLILTISASGINWIMEGYDLPKISKLVDWINVLAFDYFGPWNSTWGTYTGPISPLYHGAPDGFPGKLNIHSTIKKYVCDTLPEKIVLGIGVFGRYWTNVDEYADNNNKDPLYRRMKNGKGGFIPYREIISKWLKEVKETFDNSTKTSYLWSEKMKTLISFESPQSLAEKVKYASNYGLGGIALWSIDMDSEDDYSSLNKVIENFSCSTNETFSCNPIKERRFWTQYDDNGKKDRMCGKIAPLINGYYPICDTYDSGYSCCSSEGYCGSGKKFCECNGCIDYGKNSSEILKHSIKPYMQVEWLTLDLIEPYKPVCGPKARRLPNGRIPICNPEDERGHCCSEEGYCGVGPKFCECKNCHDFSVQI